MDPQPELDRTFRSTATQWPAQPDTVRALPAPGRVRFFSVRPASGLMIERQSHSGRSGGNFVVRLDHAVACTSQTRADIITAFPVAWP